MKATEQYFPVVLIIVLCTAAVMFESVVKSQSVTICMKAFVKYFPGVFCIAPN